MQKEENPTIFCMGILIATLTGLQIKEFFSNTKFPKKGNCKVLMGVVVLVGRMIMFGGPIMFEVYLIKEKEGNLSITTTFPPL